MAQQSAQEKLIRATAAMPDQYFLALCEALRDYAEEAARALVKAPAVDLARAQGAAQNAERLFETVVDAKRTMTKINERTAQHAAPFNRI